MFDGIVICSHTPNSRRSMHYFYTSSLIIHLLLLLIFICGATAFISSQRSLILTTYSHHHHTKLFMAGVSAITNDNIDIRILCLHGKGGNGQQFVDSSLLPLRALLEKKRSMVDNQCNDNDGGFSFHWESLTAPYELDDGGGYSWWTMPPGVRSYNAQEVR